MSTDVRILYGTDAVKMETRGAVARKLDGTLDFRGRATRTPGGSVECKGSTRSGRVGASTTGSDHKQTGIIDTSDPLRMRVIPSQRRLIAQVQRVYDCSNRDYYGPANPTNPFKPGDTVIKLDKSLPAGVFSVTIRYQGLASGVTPSDPPRIHKVLGVYAVGEMTADQGDRRHSRCPGECAVDPNRARGLRDSQPIRRPRHCNPDRVRTTLRGRRGQCFSRGP